MPPSVRSPAPPLALSTSVTDPCSHSIKPSPRPAGVAFQRAEVGHLRRARDESTHGAVGPNRRTTTSFRSFTSVALQTSPPRLASCRVTSTAGTKAITAIRAGCHHRVRGRAGGRLSVRRHSALSTLRRSYSLSRGSRIAESTATAAHLTAVRRDTYSQPTPRVADGSRTEAEFDRLPKYRWADQRTDGAHGATGLMLLVDAQSCEQRWRHP